MADRSGSTSSRKLTTKETLLRILDNYENSVREVVENLMAASNQNTTNSSFNENGMMKGVSDVIEKDDELQATLKIGEEQLAREQKIALVKDEITRKDQELVQIQSQLRDAEQLLSNALYHANKKVEALQKASKASVSSEELIKFAFRISSGSSVEAPSDWTPGDPRRPYPLDIELRAGHLGRQLPTEDDTTRLVGHQPHITDPSAGSLVSNGHVVEREHHSCDKPDSLEMSANSSLWHLSKMANDEIETSRALTGSSTTAVTVPPPVAATSALNALTTTMTSDDVEFMPSSCESTSSDSS